MVLKRLKLHHFCKNVVVSQHLATLFDNSNAVRMPAQGDQIGHGVFWQTYPKSCQITSNILEIILQNSENAFSIKRLLSKWT